MRSPPIAAMARRTALGLVLGLAVGVSLPVSAQEGDAPEPLTVEMRNSEFEPQVAMVLVNQSVTWVNRDTFNHDVTSVDEAFNSTGGPGGMAGGATFEHKFGKAGVYDYYCTVHSTGRGNQMWARLVVVEAPALQLAGAGGEANPEEFGVKWLAHWVGIISFIAVFAVLVIYYFVLKYGETVHATDHRDRKEK